MTHLDKSNLDKVLGEGLSSVLDLGKFLSKLNEIGVMQYKDVSINLSLKYEVSEGVFGTTLILSPGQDKTIEILHGDSVTRKRPMDYVREEFFTTMTSAKVEYVIHALGLDNLALIEDLILTDEELVEGTAFEFEGLSSDVGYSISKSVDEETDKVTREIKVFNTKHPVEYWSDVLVFEEDEDLAHVFVEVIHTFFNLLIKVPEAPITSVTINRSNKPLMRTVTEADPISRECYDNSIVTYRNKDGEEMVNGFKNELFGLITPAGNSETMDVELTCFQETDPENYTLLKQFVITESGVSE